MRIIVTGATGFAGREVVRAALRRGHEVLAIGGKNTPRAPDLKRILNLDLTDRAKVEALILDEFPQAIINCAALATIESCQLNPTLATQLNTDLPAQLAQLSFHVGAKLIHFSTDMVFDGARGNYGHTEQTNPLHLYGKTKAAGEIDVLKYGREHAAVIRTSLLNGNSPTGERGIHERLFLDWSSGKSSTLFTDEIRQPVSASNLADVAVELCERPNLSGVYHWAGLAPISRFEMGQAIAEYFGLDAKKYVQASQRQDHPQHAQRPRDLSLQLHPLAGKLRTPAQPFVDQLNELRVPRGCEAWYEQETGRKVVRLLEKGLDF